MSAAQFFDAYLGNVALSDGTHDWSADDLSHLAKAPYDAGLAAGVAGATLVTSVQDAVAASCDGGPGTNSVRVEYTGLEGAGGWEGVANAFGFIGDAKARVPRTGYGGVVVVRHAGCVKYITPVGWTGWRPTP